jgi:hypothetical protein
VVVPLRVGLHADGERVAEREVLRRLRIARSTRRAVDRRRHDDERADHCEPDEAHSPNVAAPDLMDL